MIAKYNPESSKFNPTWDLKRGALRCSGTGSVWVRVRGTYGFRNGAVFVVRHGFVQVGISSGPWFVRVRTGQYGLRTVVRTCLGTGLDGFEFVSAQRTEDPASQVGSY